MLPTLQTLGLDRLNLDDRLAVAEAISDSVVREVEASPLTPAQQAELERRLADRIGRPEAVTRVQLNSLGGVGTVAGVCTQTPEFASLRLAFRGLSTDPGHDLGAHCGTPQRIWLHPVTPWEESKARALARAKQ